MVQLETSQELIKVSQDLKHVKRLIKYINGFPKTPNEQKKRIGKNIDYLKNKLQTDDLVELNKLKIELEKRYDHLIKIEKDRTYSDHLRGWYLRPLISHFDNTHKLQTFFSTNEGAGALKNKLQLFIPQPYLTHDRDKTIKQLQHFFKFKAKGKGTPDSNSLEHQFYEQFEFTSANPFPNTTIGALGLPVIWYNVTDFGARLKRGEEGVLVTGLCPLSTISDEIGFLISDNKVIRPNLGFETLQVVHKDIIDLVWPRRPIISDYIILKNILELYKYNQKFQNLSVIIWYPYHEYYLDLTENIFKNYLELGIIQKDQIRQGLDEIKKRYFKLIEYVKSELDLLNAIDVENIKIIKVDEKCHNDLKKFAKKFDFSFFKYIYGSWVGNELRRRLYNYLVLKHIKPVFEGKDVLHLDTSYELWVDLLGSQVVESFGHSETFSWISYPAVPSLSLGRMRDYNASNNDKLYIAEERDKFQDRLNRLSKKYLLHIAPLVLGKDINLKRDKSELIYDFKAKLLNMNEYLQY